MLSNHNVYIVVFLLLLSACSPAMEARTVDVQLRAKPAARTIVVNEAHNRRSVKLAVGDTLIVSLPTNPGSGYSWQVASRSKSVLARVGSISRAKAVMSVHLGARTQKRFFFNAIKSGKTRLRLVYRQPFERTMPNAPKFEVLIWVRE